MIFIISYLPTEKKLRDISESLACLLFSILNLVKNRTGEEEKQTL